MSEPTPLAICAQRAQDALSALLQEVAQQEKNKTVIEQITAALAAQQEENRMLRIVNVRLLDKQKSMLAKLDPLEEELKILKEDYKKIRIENMGYLEQLNDKKM
jgi:predicted Abi (CAAX) family protease